MALISGRTRGRLIWKGAQWLVGAPAWLTSPISGAPVESDGQTLDPRVQWMLRLDKLARTRLRASSADAARRNFRRSSRLLVRADHPHVDCEDLTIPGKTRPIPVRLYRPPALQAPAPMLVFFHGGGFVVGDLDTHDGACRTLAELGGCLVAAVDYRLAPEHPFPAAVEDAWAALQWGARDAVDLGADPTRLAVGGDSAGGNLAAVVAVLARDAGDPELRLQLLLYPGTHLDCQTESRSAYASGYLLSAEDLRWFHEQYVPDAAQRTDPRASPLLAEDLRGVAPACVLTAGFDPLRDEGRAYASCLAESGVPTSDLLYPGLVHGFLSFTGPVPAAQRALEDAASALRTALSLGHNGRGGI